MAKKRDYDDPRFDRGHGKPRTRREFLAQGFLAGSGMAIGSAMLTLCSGPAFGGVQLAVPDA